MTDLLLLPSRLREEAKREGVNVLRYNAAGAQMKTQRARLLEETADRIDAALAATRAQIVEMKRNIRHTRECDRWNNHSDGEADFRESRYICQCYGKQLDQVLAFFPPATTEGS